MFPIGRALGLGSFFGVLNGLPRCSEPESEVPSRTAPHSPLCRFAGIGVFRDESLKPYVFRAVQEVGGLQLQSWRRVFVQLPKSAMRVAGSPMPHGPCMTLDCFQFLLPPSPTLVPGGGRHCCSAFGQGVQPHCRHARIPGERGQRTAAACVAILRLGFVLAVCGFGNEPAHPHPNIPCTARVRTATVGR